MKRVRIKRFALLLTIVLTASATARACDLCALYSSASEHRVSEGGLQLSLAEQHTYFGRTQTSGKFDAEQPAEHLSSLITTAVGSYGLTDRVALELHLPVIYRRYQRLESEQLVHDSESGLGDLSLVTRVTAWRHSQDDMHATVNVLAGLKLPTGDSDKLAETHSDEAMPEEDSEHHHDEEEMVMTAKGLQYLRHAGHDHEETVMESAIHGHDLALGSGSVDLPLGVEGVLQWGRAFADASLQYSIRTEGDHQYEYGDDLLWAAGAGYNFIFDDTARSALRLNLSGEIKDKDKIAGARDPDTALNAKFIGPELVYCAQSWAAHLAVDLPLNIENSGTQVVADYRLRAGVTLHF